MELKHCPFCGDDGAQIQMKKKHADFPYRVKCWQCGAKSDYCRTRESAVRAWNRRVNDV